MKKSILNLGKALNKDSQREINGGFGARRYLCPSGGRALVGCINGTLVGFCAGGVTVNFGPCL